MNDEIKEILECMEEIADCTFTTDTFELNFEDTKILLDYITNLQQENERLKEDEHFCTECGFTNIEQLALCYVDYKSRCEKASEYIKNCKIVDKDKIYPLLEEQFGEDLLNILQNGSDSQ